MASFCEITGCFKVQKLGRTKKSDQGWDINDKDKIITSEERK